MKKLGQILTAIILCMVVVACGSNDAKDKKVKVGIIQYMDHNSLNAVRTEFIKELEAKGYKEGDNLEIDYQNAQGDQSNLKTITSKLAKDSDLILAIATPAAQAMANETKDVPILFSAVTDPVEAGLVESWEKPGKNVSGTSDGVDVAKQVELIKKADKNAKTVGLIYNAGEQNSKVQVQQFKEAVEKEGLKTVEASVATTNDVKQAMKSLSKKADVIYAPTDNTVASSMEVVGEVAKDEKIPVICGSEEQALTGGLASYGTNFSKLGEQTAQMAIKIIKDEAKIADIPVEKPADVRVVVNEAMAKILGINPESLK